MALLLSANGAVLHDAGVECHVTADLHQGWIQPVITGDGDDGDGGCNMVPEILNVLCASVSISPNF